MSNLSGNHLRDALVTVINDHDIPLKMFGNKQKDMTLEEVYKIVGVCYDSYFHTQ